MNFPGHKMRCAIYIRVSSKEQLEGHSLEAQKALCQEFARSRGWEIVALFEGEGESAKTDKRKGFQRAIAFLRAGGADVFLTHKVDRFARNLFDALTYWHELKTLGVTYCSVIEQFDFTTPMGWLMMVMLAALAELFLKNLSAETAKGKRQRAIKGFWNGDLSFGYRVAADGLHAEPDPVTGPGVQLAFSEYAKGVYNDLDIARLMNAAGYRSRGKRGSNPFSKDTVCAMLQNPFYKGVVTYKGEEFPGRHVALIDPELFERAQAMRRRRRMAPRRGNRNKVTYPLSQLVFCADCRRALRGMNNNGRRIYRDPDREHDGVCQSPRYISADKLEANVAGLLMSIELSDVHQLVERAGNGHDPATAARRRIHAEAKRRRANELYLEGLIDRAGFDRAKLEAQAELDAIRPASAFDVARAADLLRNLPRLWELANAQEKQTLLQAMLERVFVCGTEIVAIQPTVDLFPSVQGVWSGPDGGPGSPRPQVPPALRQIALIAPATPPAQVGPLLATPLGVQNSS